MKANSNATEPAHSTLGYPQLEELHHCDGALRLEQGNAGPWLTGASMASALEGLPRGRAGG